MGPNTKMHLSQFLG